MKKIFLVATVLSSIVAQAQGIVEDQLVMFGTSQIYGTSRFTALGGAMGAIGGDASSVSLNPAASSIFNFKHFSASSILNTNYTQNTYQNNKYKARDMSMGIPNVALFSPEVIINDKNELVKRVYGFNFQTSNSYNYNSTAKGVNKISGINYFLDQANNQGGVVPLELVELKVGETVTDLYDYLNTQPNGFSSQQAMLAYQAFLINPDASGYISNMEKGSYKQLSELSSSGSKSALSFNMSTEYDGKFSWGLNLNLYLINHDRFQYFEENNTSFNNVGVKKYSFSNQMNTNGTGFSVDLGTIYKVTDDFRVGLSYKSASWSLITDRIQQYLKSEYADSGITKSIDVSPNLITEYEPYVIKLPSSLTTSLGYVFNKKGFISLDYQYKNFSNTKYSTEGFEAINNYYANELQATHDVRLGCEYRIKRWTLRGGFRKVNSPYKNKQYISGTNSASMGLGYGFGKSRIDLGYTTFSQDLLRTPLSSGINSIEKLNQKNNFIHCTYSVNL